MLQTGTLTANRWINALRATLGEAKAELSDLGLERLRHRLSQLAWRADCPSVDSVAASSIYTEGYARHLLTRGATGGYEALLIAWPPNHQTPLHDHAGLWGIELVLDGALSVSEYRVDRAASRTTLIPRRLLVLGISDAAAFAGHDYAHMCRNLSANRAALSLHVYGGALERYCTFSVDETGDCRVTNTHARIVTLSA